MNELILLNMAEGVGPIKTKALLERFKAPENIFKADVNELMQVAGIGRKIAENILAVSKEKSLLDEEFKLIKKYNVKTITLFDEGYPSNLKEIYDPPIVLYVKGNLEPADKMAVAIVGCRRCSYYGRQTAHRLAKELAGMGITIVSGMARGIDTAAHNGALSRGGRTIAVLGNGLASIYPPENKGLADRIAQSGALISEFSMAQQPLPENFPRRNRIISGLSLGTVVIEAAKDSGALITARCAMEQGREVFAAPGEAGLKNSFGPNRLIKDGAKLIEEAIDIIEELRPAIRDFCRQKGQPPADDKVALRRPQSEGINGQEQKVLQFLKQNNHKNIDQIAEDLVMPVSCISGALTKLEIKGLIKRLPGNVFVNIEE